MSLNQSFTCPDCYAESTGVPGTILTCPTCTHQFTAVVASLLEEDELTLAPINETRPAASPLPLPVTGNDNVPLHLEQQLIRPDTPCRKCNELMDVNAIECPHCGFNVTLGRKLDPTELDPYHGVYGFDRYLMGHTQDGSSGGLMTWFHIFFVFVGFVLILVWPGWTYFVIPALGIIYAIYRIHASVTRAFQRGKGVIPQVLLFYNRLTTWKGFVSSNDRDDCILSMRSAQFDDNSIASIEHPLVVEVMDIAGSSITNDGIRYLTTFHNLRALVVGSCNVSEAALDELQTKNPRVCIWRP